MATREPERWAEYGDLEKHFGFSRRWFEYRVSEGMPSAVFGRKRKFRISEAERWLEREGHMVKGGDR